jgi:hypothetical protein
MIQTLAYKVILEILAVVIQAIIQNNYCHTLASDTYTHTQVG